MVRQLFKSWHIDLGEFALEIQLIDLLLLDWRNLDFDFINVVGCAGIFPALFAVNVLLKFFEEPKAVALLAVIHDFSIEHHRQDLVRRLHLLDFVTDRACIVLLGPIVLS